MFTDEAEGRVLQTTSPSLSQTTYNTSLSFLRPALEAPARCWSGCPLPDHCPKEVTWYFLPLVILYSILYLVLIDSA